MSSGSQIVSYLVAETTPGVTPIEPAWDTLRLTGNSMTPNVSTETSEEIRADRMAGGSIITSLDYQGDLSAEFSAVSFDQLLEAAFYGDWTADVLEVGSSRHTFTHVKGYQDIGVWATFRGLHIGTLALEIPEEGKITCTFTGMALESEDGTTNPTTGDTINPPTETVPMGSATSVGDVLINGQTLAGEACVSALSMTIDNTMQVQRCLGRAGPGALIATRANITGQVTLAWSAASYQIWKKMLTREAVGIVFPLEDAAGNSYTFEIPAAELDGDLPDGGNESIIQVQLNFTAKLTPVKVTRVLAP
ncbi:phage tail tube protein [Vreelandella aquamarina]|jgi:hypothetical protein|uniref:phage tail tube protein n=1 Tax=Vreelandella aquamarina TaxID=77097 RepID=UPI001396A287|nr:phage tail tube protein [Halomonas meridiana]